MPPHRADHSRSHYHDRGGGYSAQPPRRDRERDDRRDRDHYRDERARQEDRRRREDEQGRGGARGFDDRRRDDRRRDERRDDRRDRDRDRDRDRGARRSRSPPRRDRYRERSRDARDRRDYRDRSDRSDRYDPQDSRRRSDAGISRGSQSATPDVRPSSRGSNTSHISHAFNDNRSSSFSRDTYEKVEAERKKQEAEQAEEAKKAARLARTEAWKQKQLAKKQAESPAASSPVVTAPSTPAVAPTPSEGTTNAKAPIKKPKQAKEVFQLDPSAAARPAPFKSATRPAGTTVPNSATVSSSTTNPAKLGAFGVKAKAAADDSGPVKKTLLDDEDTTGKRSFQALPSFVPLDGQELDTADANKDEDEGAMSDIGSPDEANNAELQAQLEKRRAEVTNADVNMEEAPAVADETAQAMDIDDAAGAEDDVDPLDAYMNDLAQTRHDDSWAPQGQALFAEDEAPTITAVEEEDLLALAASKKKKKEIPVVDHSKVEYEPFRKNFYTEPVEVQQMTPEDVADLRLELDGINVKPADVPRPVTKWAQMGLLQPTMDVFAKLRYTKPTPIQAQAIPIAESGMDLIGVAKTGSGKTLAFGIPMIRHILDQAPLKSSDGPIGLILAPTRELSTQIVNELKPFLKASKLDIACAYGGAPIADQIAMIKRGGIHVLCATPGRLIDLLQSNSGRVLNFKRVTYVVLDEADRMFDMGFEPQVMKILANVRPDRQGILFSATFPKNMAALARKALNKPVEVTVGGRSVVAPEVSQEIKVLPSAYESKIQELLRQLGMLFAENENSQVLIFVERQETAEDLLSKLIKAKYSAVNTIHGAKDQTDRSEAITDFKQGVLPILIATSVAARGLDVPGLAMVINFDCPTHLEDYVHRCGRTGRAGNKGKAITFLENPGQERFATFIVKALKQSGAEIPADVQKIADDFNKNGEAKWYGGFGGKGLEKLDAARDMEKKREKRAHKIGDEEDEESEDELVLPGIKKKDDAAAATTTEEAAAELPSYMQILSNRIVVNKTARPEPGPTKPMSAIERAKAAAAKVDGRLSKKGQIHHGQPVDNKGPDAGAFHSTIEINDFPQKARWAVTNRTNVVKILDSTGVSITTKGRMYQPNEPVGDEPKLYILVEGDTEMAVTDAMQQMTRLLRDATLAAAEPVAARGPTGRYTV